MKNKNQNLRNLTKAGVIAALYIALTAISNMFGLASGAIQVRISEALCVLPVYTFTAVPGVTIGCLISNILFGGTLYDMIFGTLATLIGALIAYLIRKKPYLASIPTIASNAVIIPAVLILQGIGGWNMFPYFALTVGIGEIIACGVFGTVMIAYFEKHTRHKKMLFE
ncbi:MAG: QueT transporter family protein [Clostridia bacterium]|nr:QueT transporter family protein [Clostridia bacterium]